MIPTLSESSALAIPSWHRSIELALGWKVDDSVALLLECSSCSGPVFFASDLRASDRAASYIHNLRSSSLPPRGFVGRQRGHSGFLFDVSLPILAFLCSLEFRRPARRLVKMSQRLQYTESKVANVTMDEDFETTDLPAEKAGTAADRRDMHRMGQTQEFKRNFSFIPIFGFAAVLMMTWASVLRYEVSRSFLASVR